MKLNHLSITLIIAGSLMAPALAQSPAGRNSEGSATNPVEKIVEESEGNVEIDIPENIMNELLKEEQSSGQRKSQESLRPGINKIDGYRIQVFGDGHNQSSLESRAKARGSAIAAKFPKYRGQVYSFSSAPNWYTRVGNFRSASEAQSALAELKRAFPQFAGEMRVVKSRIVVIK